MSFSLNGIFSPHLNGMEDAILVHGCIVVLVLGFMFVSFGHWFVHFLRIKKQGSFLFVK